MPPKEPCESSFGNHIASEDMENRRRNSSNRRRDSDLNSTGGGSNGTPSSVYLAANPLARELSDLSGSNVSGAPSLGPSKGAVPGNIYDPSSIKGPWRQAYVISKMPPPKQVRPVSKGNSTAVIGTKDSVEVVDNFEGSLHLNNLSNNRLHNRIPVLILLLDASRQIYEMMQIWIDRSIDSVRDIQQALQSSIPDKWRQAYDGIFQVRGNRFTQLIHILGLKKYDVQPYEILIAKPWSMTAKVTIGYATSAIRHLTSVGVIATDAVDKSAKRVFRPKSENSPLLISKEALRRVYAPEGILSHYHAVQFLTFSPPFDSYCHQEDPANDESNSSLGSHCGSAGSDGKITTKRVIDELRSSPKSIIELKVENNDESHNKNLNIRESSSQIEYSKRISLQDSLDDDVLRERRPSIISRLKCCRPRERVEPFHRTCCTGIFNDESPHEHRTGQRSSQFTINKVEWAGVEFRTITEDHSLAEHSMSNIPLLSSERVSQDPRSSRMETENFTLRLAEF